MTDDPQAHRRAKIDAIGLDWAEVIDDGRRLCLRLHDRAGRPATVCLPIDCLGAVLAAVPRRRTPDGTVHRLDGWSLGHDERGMLLTLQLPDGGSITFAIKPWQIQAIASLAGQVTRAPGRLN